MQVLKILWARRLIVVAAFGGALAGGGFVTATAPPRYLATARVALNFIKSDPATGSYINSKNADSYVATQAQMIRDYQVAVPAAQMLGWLDSPEFWLQYAGIPGADPQKFPHWVANRIIAGLGVRRVEDSNILEIGYQASHPRLSAEVAEAVRQAYIDASVNARRRDAEESATRFAAEAERLTLALQAAEQKKVALERAMGVHLSAGDVDIENARLRRMVKETPRSAIIADHASTSALELADLDVQLAQAAASLGPNHPRLAQLHARREAVKAEVAAEQARTSGRDSIVQQQFEAKAALLEAQKAKVLAQREQVLLLRLEQDEIENLREQLNSSVRQMLSMRQLATGVESGITAIGVSTPKPRAVFPNPVLTLGGAGGLGLVLGILLALLIELMDRRIRTPRDLELATCGAVVATIPRVDRRQRLWWMLAWPWLNMLWRAPVAA